MQNTPKGLILLGELPFRSKKLQSNKEIEFLLVQELHKKEYFYAQTKKELDLIFLDVPSAIPHPDGALRVTQARTANSAALKAYMGALREFSDLVVLGKIPERFESSKIGCVPTSNG